MSKLATVDVIIPTYNGLPYLKDAIRSVLNQTHKDLELYVIDDGSTDDTEAYVASIKDKRVHYHRKKNGGQAEARNLGIKLSDSTYIAFLDADDIWYPEKLEKQVNALGPRDDYAMVYGFHELIDENSKEVGQVRYSRSGDLSHYLLGGNKISGSASMVLIRRNVFDKVGEFREDLMIGEDWEMWLRIAQKYKIYCIEESLAALRVLPGGMQKGYIKMAEGLDYMLPLMLKEFKPGWRGRARLKGVCYFESAHQYYTGGDIDRARKNFRKLVFSNPFRIEPNRKYVRMYLRLLFGGSWHYTPRQKAKQLLGRSPRKSGK